MAPAPTGDEVEDGPRNASARRYLRSGLPSIYQEGDFGMRFVGALEQLLDPLVGTLDGLPAHFEPSLVEGDQLQLLAGGWASSSRSRGRSTANASWCGGRRTSPAGVARGVASRRRWP